MPQALGSFVYHQLRAKSPGTCSPVQDAQSASSPRRAEVAALGCKAFEKAQTIFYEDQMYSQREGEGKGNKKGFFFLAFSLRGVLMHRVTPEAVAKH